MDYAIAMMFRFIPFCAMAVVLTGCQSPTGESVEPIPQANPQAVFFEALSAQCRKAFAGSVVSEDAVDADWRKETLVMHVAECSADEIRIPLSVGENRSRTWVVGWHDGDLRLKHVHRHKDGTLDDVTWYGGKADPTSATDSQINFPVDDYSKQNFLENGLDVSVNNTWSITLTPDMFTYQLSRHDDVDGRDFRAAFDITRPVPVPTGEHW